MLRHVSRGKYIRVQFTKCLSVISKPILHNSGARVKHGYLDNMFDLTILSQIRGYIYPCWSVKNPTNIVEVLIRSIVDVYE